MSLRSNIYYMILRWREKRPGGDPRAIILDCGQMHRLKYEAQEAFSGSLETITEFMGVPVLLAEDIIDITPQRIILPPPQHYSTGAEEREK